MGRALLDRRVPARRSRSACCSGRSSTGFSRRAADDRRPISCGCGVFVALPFAHEPGADRRARGASRASRPASSGPAVYAGLPNLVDEDDLAARELAASRRSRTSPGWSGRCIGGVLARRLRPGRRVLRSTPSTFLVSALLCLPDPGASCSRRDARRQPRPLPRPRRGLRASSSARGRCSTVLVAWTIAMLGTRRVNVAEVVAREGLVRRGRLRARRCSWPRAGSACVVGSLARRLVARARGRSATVYGERDRADGGRRSALAAVAPNVWVAAAVRGPRRLRQRRRRSSATRCSCSAALPTRSAGARSP